VKSSQEAAWIDGWKIAESGADGSEKDLWGPVKASRNTMVV
jgi:hypothetical protein